MNSWTMYWRFVLISIRAQMQYRTSFLLSAFAQLAATGIEIAGIWALFARFGSLDNWSLAEVCLFYGVVNVTFSLADALSTGFDVFGPRFVRTGNFDRLLLRPRNTVLQLLGHELALRRVGRLIQGVVVFTWACMELQLEWSPGDIGLLLFAVGGGIGLFFGLIVCQATLSFWTVESLEIMNTMTYGGVQTAQYPMDIYQPWFRKFFTYIIPLACVSYFPIVNILHISDPLGSPAWLQSISPAAGIIFLFFSLALCQFGVRHYTSTGN